MSARVEVARAMHRLSPMEDGREDLPRPQAPWDLTELLTETRILLPGTQVFLAFLMMLPFTERFEELVTNLEDVFLATFLATLLALACFVMPAAYHRIARPILHKAQFKVFVNTFLIAGLGAWTIAMILATYLVTAVVAPGFAGLACLFVGILLVTLWWLIPIVRLHDRLIDQPT